MSTLKYWFWAVLILGLFTWSCEQDTPEPDPEDPGTAKTMAPLLTRKVNTFIKDVMTDVYLWYKDMPVIDERYESDTKAYFKKLLVAEDKWSFVSDNIKEIEDSFQGIEKSYGYSLTFGRFSNAPDNYYAIVEYVHPRTPASRAGFIRGDIIFQIDGGSITTANWRQLLSGNAVTVTRGVYANNTISAGTTVSMVAEELSLNPVLMNKVIEHGGKRIGYLLYTQFIARFNDSLKVALQSFRDAGITDLVLDLRYNPGGQTTAAQYLCSALAPLNAVNASQPLVTYQWNDKYMAYFQSRNNLSQLIVPFISSVPVKLGLNKLHILTGPGTASASELTIIGLEPYMEIITVGGKTSGKYTASITFKPGDVYKNESDYKDFDNWGVQPIVLRFANSQGVTNFKNGFVPKFAVDDDLLPAVQLGDKTEPLLARALENITGTPVLALKQAREKVPFEVIQRGSSRFDDFKTNLPLNDIIDPETLFPDR